MKLKSLITLLEKADECKYVNSAIGNPHSWRGSYDELAFEPTDGKTVGDMLREVKSAMEETFYGWKGGEYTYDENTPVHISHVGSSEEQEEWFIQMISELFE